MLTPDHPNGETVIHWFRNDFRLHDNAALYQACQDARLVLPVYILDPATIKKLF